ncbi:hypothetical protein [Fimbriimonas ginsengisoli]|uniref:Uncharacterized protein n=1 Tax=Fimbriimonas ginsengisoli Gsoil 348 TaxID=661478 RepID=A0A068NQU8_FIMGI|nr:hypothetical protein [Fimbriimonas ginsengisoli]AIE85100.1 hypothetical protein OP10G_1732 [Fimbriimonas ginsengisoli Gsoil 348]
MIKPFFAATAASFATAVLIGFAFASPQTLRSSKVEAARPVNIKFEWVQAAPKSVDSLTITVDSGQVANISRPMGAAKGMRTVTVTPILQGESEVTLDVDVRSDTQGSQHLKTRVTVPMGMTKVISAATSKTTGSREAASEELVFVTANL